MVLKYLIKDYPLQTLYFGIANVIANSLVMLRYALNRFLYARLEIFGRSLTVHTALSCYGSPRTWRMTTPTTLPCERGHDELSTGQ